MAKLKDLVMEEVLEALMGIAEGNPSDAIIVEESIPRLSAHERAYCKKVCILLNKIRRNRIPFEWDGDAFVTSRMMPSGWPMMGYLYVDWETLEYCFDNDAETLAYDTRVSTAVEYCIKWRKAFKNTGK